MAKPSVKQQLAAIRQMFDYLVTAILSMNPAASVRGPQYVVKRGKTPVLSAEQARQLLDSIDPGKLSGLRDRALIGLLLFSFARVGAANALLVADYLENEKRQWLRLHEKGGKRHQVPCHHDLVNYLNAWITAAGIGGDKKSWLFRSIRKGNRLTKNRMATNDVLRMIKRRAKEASLPYSTCCHTFRGTGITTYLKSGGTLEHAQQIAAHESPRATKLYYPQPARAAPFLSTAFIRRNGIANTLTAPDGGRSNQTPSASVNNMDEKSRAAEAWACLPRLGKH